MAWTKEQCETWRDWAQERYMVSDEELLELWRLCAAVAQKNGDIQAYQEAKARIKELESEVAAND